MQGGVLSSIDGVCYNLIMCSYSREVDMSGLRKDKAPAQKDRFSVLASVELITALNRMADTKRISRNALIIQLLTKALKRHIEEAK